MLDLNHSNGALLIQRLTDQNFRKSGYSFLIILDDAERKFIEINIFQNAMSRESSNTPDGRLRQLSWRHFSRQWPHIQHY